VSGKGCCSLIRVHFLSRQTSPHYPKLNRLNRLSARSERAFAFFLLLVSLCIPSVAQAPSAASQRLLYGSIFTSQGRPAAEVAVEIRDLHGMEVASAVTDGSGRFEISGAAKAGEYVFLVASDFDVRAEQVLLDPPDLELSLALPARPANSMPSPGRYRVSAGRLEVSAKARTHLAAAQREFRKMKFNEAEREIDAALQSDPTFAQAFTMRAFIQLAEKNPRQAVKDAKRAASLDPDDPESFIALAMAYNSLGEFYEAEGTVQRALSLRPESWQGRLELAKSFYGRGDFVVALRELDLGHIDFPDAHLVRGNVMMSLDRKREAGDEFSAFLREAPNDPRDQQIRQTVAALAQANSGATPSAR
jgi:tetratricopeptide (TPR) repeat protein